MEPNQPILNEGFLKPFINSPETYSPKNIVTTQPFVPGIEAVNKYDVGLREGLYQPFVRGANQSAMEQILNASKRALPSIAAKMGAGFAGVASLADEGLKLLKGDKASWDNAFNSPLMTAFEDMEKDAEASNPIYGSRKYLEGNLADKIWTTSFWTQEGMDAVEFLASAYAPGKLITSGTQAVSKIGKLKSLSTALETMSAKVGIDNLGGVALSTLYNTAAESMVEGKSVFDDVKKSLETQFPAMSAQEIEAKAGKAARDTFALNMMYLMAPNFLENKWLLGKAASTEMRSLASKMAITEEEIKSSLPKDFLKGFLSEGLWEENIQSAVSESEKRLALGQDSRGQVGYFVDGIKGLAKALPDIFTFNSLGTSAEAGSYQDQAAASVLLGGLVGGPMSALSSREEAKQKEAIKSSASKTVASIDNLIKIAGEQLPDYIGNTLKTFGNNPDGSINYLNSKGEVEYDLDKLKAIQFNQRYQKSLIDEATLAAYKGDPLHLEYTTQKALSNMAWQLFDMSKMFKLNEEDIDFLIDHRINNQAKEEAKGNKLQSTEATQLNVADIFKQRKQQIKDYIKLGQKLQEEFMSKDDFASDKTKVQFNKDVLRAAFYAQTLNHNLDTLLTQTTNPETREQINSLKADNDLLLADLKKNKDNLFSKYKNEVAPFLEVEDSIRLQEEKILQERDASTKERLQEELAGLKLKKEYYRVVEGTSKLVTNSEELNKSLSDIYTSNMFGNRDNNTQISTKNKAMWIFGNTALASKKLQGNKTIEEVAENLRDIFSSKTPVTESPEIEKAFSVVHKHIQTLNSRLEELAEVVDPYDYDEVTPEIAEYQSIESEITKYEEILKLHNIYKQQKGIYKGYYDALVNNDTEFFVQDFINNFTAGAAHLKAKWKTKDNKVSEEIEEEVSYVEGEIRKIKATLTFITTLNVSDNFKSSNKDKLLDYKEFLEKALAVLGNKAQQRAKLQQVLESRKVDSWKTLFSIPEIKNLFQTVIGNDPEIKLGEWENETQTYQYILAAISKLSTTLDSTQKAAYLDILKTIFKKKAIDNVSTIKTNPDHIADYVNNINGLINQTLFDLFFDIESPVFRALFTEFQQHLDLNIFKTQLDSQQWTQIEEINRDRVRDIFNTFFDNHTALQELQLLIDSFNTPVSLQSIREAEDALGIIPPSFQQHQTILQSVLMLSGNSKIPLAIRGIIGTGKTKVVLKTIVNLLLKVSSYKEDDVLLVGHSTASTEQLNKAILNRAFSQTAEDISNSLDSLEGKKLIVIDEAAAIPNDVLRSIMEKAKASNVKVLLAGDASQNRVDTLPAFVYDKTIRFAESLSVAYRSNVASILNGALQFKDKQTPVSEVAFLSNKETVEDFKNSPSDSVGTLALSETDMMEVLSKDSPRTRVLIVTNKEEEVVYSKTVHPSVKVINFLDVQGVEYQEAYLLIKPALKDKYGEALSTARFNTALYTSIGRATVFAGINLEGTKVKTLYSADLPQQADNIAKDFEIIKDEYDQARNTFRGELGLPVTPIKKSAVVQDIQNEPIADVEDEDYPEISPTPTEPVEEMDGGTFELEEEVLAPSKESSHSFHYPNNKALKRGSNIDFSRVYLVKSDDIYYVLAKDTNYSLNKRVYTVAVLGNTELGSSNNLTEYLTQNNLLGKSNTSVRGINKKGNVFEYPSIDSEAITSFVVSNSNNLKIRYNKNKLTGIKLDKFIPDFITNLFKNARGNSNLIPVKEMGLEGTTPDWKKLGNYATIKVFNNAAVANLDHNRGFIPAVGVPYLILNGLKWESESTGPSTHSPLYIRLEPKNYNPRYMQKLTYVQDYINVIKSFRDAIKELEKYNPKFNLNATTKEGGKTVMNPLNLLIEEYAKFAFEPSEEIKAGKKTYKLAKQVVPEESIKKLLGKYGVDSLEAINNLDIIIHATYGIEYGPEKITFEEYKKLKSEDKANVIGAFVPTQEVKYKKPLDKLVKSKPDLTWEQQAEGIKIPDNANVYYYEVDDMGHGNLKEIPRITKNRGKLQYALNAIASANTKLQMAVEVNKTTKSGKKSSITIAKQALASMATTSYIDGLINKYLTGEITPFIGGIEKAIKADDFEISKGQYLLDGSYYDDSVSIDTTPKGEVIILHGKKPLAILLIAEEIVKSVSRSFAHKTENYFPQFASSEQAQLWYNRLVDTLLSIDESNSIKPLNTQDLDQLLEVNEQGTYPNVKVPIHMNSVFLREEHKNFGLDTLGNLHKESNREILEEMFDTQFENVKASNLTVQIPSKKDAPKNSTTEPLPQQHSSGGEFKEQQIDIVEELTKAMTSDKFHTNKVPAKDVLDRLSPTDPILQKLLKLLTSHTLLQDVKIVEVPRILEILKGSKVPNVSGVIPENRNKLEIYTGSISQLEKDPKTLLHELIHVFTSYIWTIPEDQLTEKEKLFKEEISAIFNKAKGSSEFFTKFQKTKSPLDEREFIANLSNVDMYNYLTGIKIKKGDAPKGLKNIWKRIWASIVKVLNTSEEDTSNLADATYATFESYIVDKIESLNQANFESAQDEQVDTLETLLAKSPLGEKVKETLRSRYINAPNESVKKQVILTIQNSIMKTSLAFTTAEDIIESPLFKKNCK